MGDIQYKRTLFKDRQTGKAKYLLEEALKIEKNQRMSLRMMQIMGVLSASSPYRAVEEQLKKLLGISCSYEAIRQRVIAEGKEIEEQEEKEHLKIRELDYQMPEEIPEVVYTQRQTQRSFASKIKNKEKKKGRRRHLEVKAGTGYSRQRSQV